MKETRKLKAKTTFVAAHKVDLGEDIDAKTSMIKDREERFDSNGNLITEIQYDREGNEFERIEREFQGSLVLKMEKFYGNTTPDETKIAKYDDNANLVSEKLILSDGSQVETINYFEGKMALKSIIVDEEDGNTEIVRQYDSAGNVVKVQHQYPSGQIIETHEFVRDDKGNILEERFKNEETEEEHIVRRSFDAKGNMLSEERYSEGSLAEKSSFQYGEFGIISFERHVDSVIECGEYEYDEKGRPISRKMIEKQSSDEKGNLMLEMIEVYEDDYLKSTHVNQFNAAMQMMVPFDYFYEYEFY